MTKLEEAMYKAHRKSEEKKDTRKYHDWVYMADDQMNKVLKTVIVLVFTYGFFVAITDIWENL